MAESDALRRSEAVCDEGEGPESDSVFSTEAVAVGLIDTETATITAGNRAYAEMLGQAPEAIAGLPVEAMMAPERAAAARATLAAMRGGWIEFLEGEAELHQPSGPITVWSWSWTAGAAVPRTTVIGVGLPMTACPDRTLVRPAVDAERVIIGTLDHDWRYQHFATRCTSLLGWPAGSEGPSRLQEIVHPADEGVLLCALDPPDIEQRTFDLRLHSADGSWLDARVTVSRLFGDPASPFAALIDIGGAASRPDNTADRVNLLEAHLARIGAEIEAAGVIHISGVPENESLAMIAALPPRQREIALRLARGQRVPTIATDMFISQSTVRNHLTGIFQKFAVHSQAELMELLHRHQPGS